MDGNSLMSSKICDPSSTVKLNFNEMDKSELMKMLAFLQSELEAREIVIATLKSEKCKHILYQAKYGRLNTALVSSKVSPASTHTDNWCRASDESIFSIYDPFVAMQHDLQYVISDSDRTIDRSNSESNLKPVYDSQLSQLENLISSQKKAQMKMKEQIVHLEKKCVKLTQALEDERNKHERDAAQGDDVLVMLEKERERLKSELEYEKSHSRKLERELKRMVSVIEDQKTVIHNQRLAATVILKAKRQIENDLKAVNVLNNCVVNSNELTKFDISCKHNEGVSDNFQDQINQESHKINPDQPCDPQERQKDNFIVKSTKPNVHESQSMTKHSSKFPQTKEQSPVLIEALPETMATQSSNPIVSPVQKSRSGKQPESLLWKTYDPKNAVPTSGHWAVSLTNKSPSNIRRQLSTSITSVSSSLSRAHDNLYYYTKHPSAPSAIVSPYQKILSTPPPNSIINQAASSSASYQSSLTSYSLFNICSPTLQSLTGTQTMVATVYKSTITSTRPVDPNVGTSKSRPTINNPSVQSITQVSSPSSSSSMIRSSDSSPAIPKHVYVNGK